MGIYIFNILSLPIYKYIFKNKKQLCIVIAFQMFLILALRDDTLGVDYSNYLAGFKYIKNLSITELFSSFRLIKTAKLVHPFSYESAYVALNWIVGKIGLDFHGLLVICAAINMISFGNFIYQYSDNPVLSYAMFSALGMYTYCFGILRQSLAVSIVLWAIPAILENKRIKSIVVIFIGFLFHRTAILFLPFILLVDRNVTKKIFQYCIVIWGVLIIIAVPLYNFFIANVINFFGFSGYQTAQLEYNYLIIIMSVVVFVIYFVINFKVFDNRELNLICWGFLLSVFLEIFGMCNEVFARSVEYYFLFSIILIPNLIYKYHTRSTKKISEILVYILMIVYMMISLIDSPYNPYIIYRAIL